MAPARRNAAAAAAKAKDNLLVSDPEEEDDEEEEAVESQTNTPSAKKASQKSSQKGHVGVVMTVAEMVNLCTHYLLINQHKKIAVKRADIIKYAMNGQKKYFDEVLQIIEEKLENTFGFKLVNIENGKVGGGYTLVSNYSNDLTQIAVLQTEEDKTKRTTLLHVLNSIFLLNRQVDEDTIWEVFEETHSNEVICKRREDLHKFLRMEYVLPMYLNMETVKREDQVLFRYSWGLRAEVEFSKWNMLKMLAKHFPGKRPAEFCAQYKLAMEQDKEAVEAELEGSEDESSTNASSGDSTDEEDLEEIIEDKTQEKKAAKRTSKPIEESTEDEDSSESNETDDE